VGMCHAFDVYAYDKSGKVVDSQGRGNIYNGARSTGVGVPRYDKIVDLPEFVRALEAIDPVRGLKCGGQFSVDMADEKRIDFTGVYFVGVPTPMYEDGEADVTIVESVLDELASVEGTRIAVVKSTIPPGTTMGWNEKYKDTGLTVVFNPEFLTEANAVNDFLNQNRIVLGGPKKSVDVVRDVYKVAYPNVPIHKTSSSNAELVKYVTNTFLATKVSFANEFYQLCEALAEEGQDIDYDRTIEIAKLDTRLGNSHWQVPGPMPADDGSGRLLRGYAGSCFVKDINALIFLMKKLGLDPKVLESAWQKNLEVRPERDWENLKGRAVSTKKKDA